MKPLTPDRRMSEFRITMAEAFELLETPELERPGVRSRLWGQGLADRDGVIDLASPKVAALLGHSRKRCQQAVGEAVARREQRAFRAIASRSGVFYG